MNDTGMTIITVTHHMSEAAEAGRIIVIEDGQIVMDAPPREIFKHKQELKNLQLEVPSVSQMAEGINQQFTDFSTELIQEDEFIDEVMKFSKVEVS